MQQWLFSNLISISLSGKLGSNGFIYVTPLPMIVCLGENDFLFGHNVSDTTLVFPGSTDKNVKANSYSQVRIEKSYIAAGKDYYIQLRISELLMCKSIRHIYYCEELLVIKHKSRHSCVSTIFYNLGPKTITQNCKFDYYYNTTVPPIILDGGRDVLLANFHGPRSLKCSSINGGLSKPAPEIIYAVVNREFLCDCQLDLEHASVLRQLSSCANSSSSKMHMKFTINLAFWELFKKRSPNSASNIQPQYVEEEQVFSVNLYDPQIGRLDQPVDLERFIDTMGTDGQKMPTVEDIDYNHTSDAFLLERAFTYHGKHPQVVELPLPRVSGFTKFHNPTRPSHLVGGALIRCRRSYSPSEIRSIRAVGLEQSPAYFSRRVRSMSRTPDREHRARSLSQSRCTSSPGSFRSREHSRDRSMSPFQDSNQSILPPRRESGSASIGGRSRSPSRSPPPSKRRCPKLKLRSFFLFFLKKKKQ